MCFHKFMKNECKKLEKCFQVVAHISVRCKSYSIMSHGGEIQSRQELSSFPLKDRKHQPPALGHRTNINVTFYIVFSFGHCCLLLLF